MACPQPPQRGLMSKRGQASKSMRWAALKQGACAQESGSQPEEQLTAALAGKRKAASTMAIPVHQGSS